MNARPMNEVMLSSGEFLRITTNHAFPGGTVSKKKRDPLKDKELEFCALKFCPSQPVPGAAEPSVVLLAIKDAKALAIYVHRAFEDKTSEHDRSYVQELLPDLVQRSRCSPGAAFRQLASLSVGPLITEEVGLQNFSRHPVESLYPDLIRLEVAPCTRHRKEHGK